MAVFFIERMSNTEKPDETRGEVIDHETGKPDDTPAPATGKGGRRIDLSNLRDVRLELAYVYRLMDSGKIESADGTKRAYVLKTIHDVIVSAELERRITELEEQASPPGRPGLPAPERTLN